MIDRPHGRDLSGEELIAVVKALAERTEVWRDLVAHDRANRTYTELFRDDHVAAWLICWMDEHDTGFHDHDLSAGAVAVAEGSVREERLAIGGPPIAHTARKGDAFSFAPADIHRITHAGNGPAVTIHAYSPPLWRVGVYEVMPEGRLLRHSVSYAEELRPLGVPT